MPRVPLTRRVHGSRSIAARDDDFARLRRADIVLARFAIVESHRLVTTQLQRSGDSAKPKITGCRGHPCYIICRAWQVFDSGLNFPPRHDSLAASISAGSSHFVGHGPTFTAAHAWLLPIEHHVLNSPCSTAICWHASWLPALHAGVCNSIGAVDSIATLVSLTCWTIVRHAAWLPSLHFSVASARILATKSSACELHPEAMKIVKASAKKATCVLDLPSTCALFRAI